MKAARFLIIAIVLIGVTLKVIDFYRGRRPSRYLIPTGYIGFVRVDYDVPGAPPFPIENGFTLIQTTPGGRAETSDPFAYGMGDPCEFYYTDGVQRQRLHGDSDPYPIDEQPPTQMIWGVHCEKRDHRTTEIIFVGPKKQWDDFVAHHPDWSRDPYKLKSSIAEEKGRLTHLMK